MCSFLPHPQGWGLHCEDVDEFLFKNYCYAVVQDNPHCLDWEYLVGTPIMISGWGFQSIQISYSSLLLQSFLLASQSLC